MKKKLILKHAKGSPVNTNPLPERPINNNPVPKKKKLQIRPNFKNERPVPGLLTSPRIVGLSKTHGFK